MSNSEAAERPTYCVILDIETTGTEEAKDFIVELGMVITDSELVEQERASWLVKPGDPWTIASLRDSCSPFIQEMHDKNGLWSDLESSETERQSVANECIARLDSYGNKGDFVLAGSGVSHFDRCFLKVWMPRLEEWFRYYSIDVGILRRTLRDIVGRPDLLMPEEEKAHRALPDAEQHLRELQHIKKALDIDINDIGRTDYVETCNSFANEMWPENDEEATYDRVLRMTIAQGNKYLDANDIRLMDHGDIGRRLWVTQCHAMQTSHDTALVLQKLREIDPKAADDAAHQIWSAAYSGDSYGEWLWEWSIENDVPVHPESLKDHKGNVRTQEETKAEHYKFIEKQRKRVELAAIVRPRLVEVESLKDGITANELLDTMSTICDFMSSDELKEALNYLFTNGDLEQIEVGDQKLVRLPVKTQEVENVNG